MPKKILKKQLRIMQKTLANNTAQSWAKGFIDSMETATVSNLPLTIHLNRKRMKGLAADYKNARRRWIFLDYDGTLAEFKSDPGKTPLPVDTRSLIQKLSEDTKNTVVVISGRPQKALDEYLKGLSVGMAAEHGAFIKRDDVWHTTVEVDHSWKHVVRPLMEAYASKTPGAWVEDKKYTLVWHYRNVSAYQAKKNLTILKYVLRPEIRHLGVKAYDGKKVLEVKPPSVNKGSALRTWLHGHSGFCIVLGDDYTDEDMFMVAPKDAYTIKVGPGATTARYRLKTTKAVQELLTKLAG
jgi:trehalose 6-phosphate synthase/phosphatase